MALSSFVCLFRFPDVPTESSLLVPRRAVSALRMSDTCFSCPESSYLPTRTNKGSSLVFLIDSYYSVSSTFAVFSSYLRGFKGFLWHSLMGLHG